MRISHKKSAKISLPLSEDKDGVRCKRSRRLRVMYEPNYICIDCGIPTCNKCCTEELDEETRGWIPFRSVGYCTTCRPKARRLLITPLTKLVSNGESTSSPRPERYVTYAEDLYGILLSYEL